MNEEEMRPHPVTLSRREEQVLRLRFGNGNGLPHTQEEVAEDLNTHRAIVRMREAKALRKLRGLAGNSALKAFLAGTTPSP